jgi:hypothetical protein
VAGAATDTIIKEHPTFAEWWMFTIPSLRKEYIRWWSRTCVLQYIEAYQKFSSGLYHYDFIYREYQRFAAEQDELSEVRKRVLPPPR